MRFSLLFRFLLSLFLFISRSYSADAKRKIGSMLTEKDFMELIMQWPPLGAGKASSKMILSQVEGHLPKGWIKEWPIGILIDKIIEKKALPIMKFLVEKEGLPIGERALSQRLLLDTVEHVDGPMLAYLVSRWINAHVKIDLQPLLQLALFRMTWGQNDSDESFDVSYLQYLLSHTPCELGHCYVATVVEIAKEALCETCALRLEACLCGGTTVTKSKEKRFYFCTEGIEGTHCITDSVLLKKDYHAPFTFTYYGYPYLLNGIQEAARHLPSKPPHNYMAPLYALIAKRCYTMETQGHTSPRPYHLADCLTHINRQRLLVLGYCHGKESFPSQYKSENICKFISHYLGFHCPQLRLSTILSKSSDSPIPLEVPILSHQPSSVRWFGEELQTLPPVSDPLTYFEGDPLPFWKRSFVILKTQE